MDFVDLVLRQHFLSLHLSDFISMPVCIGNVLDKFIAGAHTTEKKKKELHLAALNNSVMKLPKDTLRGWSLQEAGNDTRCYRAFCLSETSTGPTMPLAPVLLAGCQWPSKLFWKTWNRLSRLIPAFTMFSSLFATPNGDSLTVSTSLNSLRCS